MILQSVTKSPRLTTATILAVPMDASERDVLRFYGTPPTGTMDTNVSIRDDYSGEVSAKGATIQFWTD
jgi:hypothetical protein